VVDRCAYEVPFTVPEIPRGTYPMVVLFGGPRSVALLGWADFEVTD
jgi:hypothetical protein